MDALSLWIGIVGVIALFGLFLLIDWLHSRWAWRQSIVETNAMLGQRPPRPSPPTPVPPTCADTGYPKDPRGCWSVRCQLGNTCCRVDCAATPAPPAPCSSCKREGYLHATWCTVGMDDAGMKEDARG